MTTEIEVATRADEIMNPTQKETAINQSWRLDTIFTGVRLDIKADFQRKVLIYYISAETSDHIIDSETQQVYRGVFDILKPVDVIRADEAVPLGNLKEFDPDLKKRSQYRYNVLTHQMAFLSEKNDKFHNIIYYLLHEEDRKKHHFKLNGVFKDGSSEVALIEPQGPQTEDTTKILEEIRLHLLVGNNGYTRKRISILLKDGGNKSKFGSFFGGLKEDSGQPYKPPSNNNNRMPLEQKNPPPNDRMSVEQPNVPLSSEDLKKCEEEKQKLQERIQILKENAQDFATQANVLNDCKRELLETKENNEKLLKATDDFADVINKNAELEEKMKGMVGFDEAMDALNTARTENGQFLNASEEEKKNLVEFAEEKYKKLYDDAKEEIDRIKELANKRFKIYKVQQEKDGIREIDGLNDEVAELEEMFTLMDEEIEKLKKDNSTLQDAHNEADKEAALLTKQLEDLEKSKDQIGIRKQDKIVENQQEIKKLKGEIDKLNQTVAKRDEYIKVLDSKVSTEEDTANRIENDLIKRNEEFEKLETTLKKRNKEIQVCKSTVKEKDKEIKGLNDNLEVKNEEIKFLKDDKKDSEIILDEKNDEIKTLAINKTKEESKYNKLNRENKELINRLETCEGNLENSTKQFQETISNINRGKNKTDQNVNQLMQEKTLLQTTVQNLRTENDNITRIYTQFKEKNQVDIDNAEENYKNRISEIEDLKKRIIFLEGELKKCNEEGNKVFKENQKNNKEKEIEKIYIKLVSFQSQLNLAERNNILTLDNVDEFEISAMDKATAELVKISGQFGTVKKILENKVLEVKDKIIRENLAQALNEVPYFTDEDMKRINDMGDNDIQLLRQAFSNLQKNMQNLSYISKEITNVLREQGNQLKNGSNQMQIEDVN